MGNQSYNQDYAQHQNWIKQNSGSQVHQKSQIIQAENKPVLEQSTVSHIKTQQTPGNDQKSITSKINAQFPPQLRHSTLGLVGQQPQSNIRNSQLTRVSNIGNQQMTKPFTAQSATAKILFKPQLPKTGSIMQKGQKKQALNFKFDPLTEQVDDIRVALRTYQQKLEETFVPAFQRDILQMNQFIQSQRQYKLKDKNKVLYLLKQKKHYHKLSLKFKDYDEKVKEALFILRNKDSIHQITQTELMGILQLKGSIQGVITRIQKQLPKMGWKVLINKPTNQYYLSVVTGALKDPQILKRYSELQESLTNPQILQQIANEQMMHSTTRRIEGITTQQAAKNFIEGPSDTKINNFMRGTKHPTPL